MCESPTAHSIRIPGMRYVDVEHIRSDDLDNRIETPLRSFYSCLLSCVLIDGYCSLKHLRRMVRRCPAYAFMFSGYNNSFCAQRTYYSMCDSIVPVLRHTYGTNEKIIHWIFSFSCDRFVPFTHRKTWNWMSQRKDASLILHVSVLNVCWMRELNL